MWPEGRHGHASVAMRPNASSVIQPLLSASGDGSYRPPSISSQRMPWARPSALEMDELLPLMAVERVDRVVQPARLRIDVGLPRQRIVDPWRPAFLLKHRQALNVGC